jgi:lysozyme family protein
MSFATSLPFVLRWEGGFVDHPADPGGATNKGVTQKVYDSWRAKNGQPQRSVRDLQDSEMAAIYEQNYWRAARCGEVQDKLDLAVFDTAVNMGVGRAVGFLQGSVGCAVDGGFGPATLNAVQCCDPARALPMFCNARESYYQRLVEAKPELNVFLRGWMNRLNALRASVGIPGFSAGVTRGIVPGEIIRRLPDLGEDPAFDV